MNRKLSTALCITSFVVALAVLVLLIFNKKLIGTGTQDAGVADTGQVSIATEQENQTDKDTKNRQEATENAESNQITDDTQKSETTTIVFAGDVMIGAATEQNYDKEGVSRLVSEALLAEMVNADICMVNNEFQFSTRGTPMEGKQYTFRTNPKYVQIMQDLGVDIVSLANNHALDFGTEAMQDTFATLDGAGILYAGAGDTKERAKELQIIEVNGMKFGFLAATRVIPVIEWNVDNRQPGMFAAYDDSQLVKCIEEAQEECDFLVVYIHWGVERKEYPEAYQTTIAEHCVAAGADLIIGSHPHVLQGIEFIDGKPVFYSLGNYIFPQTIAKTALIKVEVEADGTASYRLIPAYAQNGKTQLFEGAEAESLYHYMSEISPQAFVDETGRIYENSPL